MHLLNKIVLLLTIFGIFLPIQAADTVQISAILETRDHFDDEAGNNADADDPAIWINPDDPSKSLIVATLKEGGLDVYTLDGKLLQHIAAAPAPACSYPLESCNDNAPGRPNNADIIYDFELSDTKIDVIVVSERGLDKLVFFAVNHKNLDKGMPPLINITASETPLIFSANQDEVNTQRTAYGLATAADDDDFFAFVSQNDTTNVTQLRLIDNGLGKVTYRQENTFSLPEVFSLPNGASWTPCTDDDFDGPHVEGMVADVGNDVLFLGQEDVGIWKIDLDDPTDQEAWELFAKVKEFGVPFTRVFDPEEEEFICTLEFDNDPGFGDAFLSADVEGLTIYDAGDDEGYLLVSSQGDNTIVIFNRDDQNYIGSFTVVDGVVDGVDETDGMMVTNVNLGGLFTQGMVVMQDGENKITSCSIDEVERGDASNFKFVRWSDIAEPLNLEIDTKERTRK